MSSSKIQEYNLDPNMGLAKEESVQEILSQMGQGMTANVVKSVQVVNVNQAQCSNSDTNFGSCYYVDYTISSVNTEKTFVLANGGDNNSTNAKPPKARLINSTTLRVYATKESANYIIGMTVQVVEFY